jgi:hypothetical protein
MKTASNSIRPIFASLAAFLVLTANAVATAAVFAAAGITAVLTVDYGRRSIPCRSMADVVAFDGAAQDDAGAREAA